MAHLERVRCWRCAATLAKLALTGNSVVEIKCSKCNAMNRIAGATLTSVRVSV